MVYALTWERRHAASEKPGSAAASTTTPPYTELANFPAHPEFDPTGRFARPQLMDFLIRARIPFFLRLFALLICAHMSALEISWERMPGKGKDISVGADGSVFVVGSGNGNEPVYRWNGATWENRGGLAVLLAVGPKGDPWTVDKHSNMAHFQDGQWVPIVTDGTITDVAVGTNGTVYVVGGSYCNCGEVFNEAMYRLDGTNFVALSLSGVVIHPDPAGRVWTVDASTGIHRTTTGSGTTAIAGHALDLAVGANGDVWIISRLAFDGYDGDVQFWNGTSFQPAGMFGARIAVAPDGTPWVITDDNRIYRGHKVDLRIADVQAVEGQLLQFPVTLTASSKKPVTFDYQILAPTNIVGTNSPVVSSGKISLPAGQTNIVITYQLPNDSVFNVARVYSLQVTNVAGANLMTTTVIGRVTDDEVALPTLSVTNALAVLEGQTLDFPVTLLPAATQEITVSYRIYGPTNSPATNHGVLTTGSIVFPVGATNAVIHFATLTNLIAEPDQNIRIELQPAVGALTEVTTAIGPVLDVDVNPYSFTGLFTNVASGLRFQGRVPTREAFQYTLERRNLLSGGSGWEPVTSHTGSGGEILLADPAEFQNQVYYRVTVRRRL